MGAADDAERVFAALVRGGRVVQGGGGGGGEHVLERRDFVEGVVFVAKGIAEGVVLLLKVLMLFLRVIVAVASFL